MREAERLLNDGEYLAAIRKYEEAQRLHGKPSRVIANKTGLAYQFMGDHESAIQSFTTAIRLNDSAINRVGRSYSYMALLQCEDAISDGLIALEREPAVGQGYHTGANANAVIAECYAFLGEYDVALQHIEVAITIAKEYEYEDYIIDSRENLKDLILEAQQSQIPTPTATAAPTPTPEPTVVPTATPIPTATPLPTVTPTPTLKPRVFRISPCRAGSQRKIDWEQRPTITDDYLVMSGRTVDDAHIHNARSPSDSDGKKWPAFTLNNLYQINEERRLESVGKIWPRDMESRLSGTGTPNVLAERYDVSGSSFDVEAKLPTSLLAADIQLVIAVWGTNPGSGERAIGAECASYN